MVSRARGSDIRVAPTHEVETSAEILEAAAARGASDGMPSWEPGVFTGTESVGMLRLRSDAERDGLYLVWCGDRAVATFSLLESDARYWPTAGDDALYLHRFAVRTEAAGVGRFAIEWMVSEARRRGRSYIRLDCLAENSGIRRYYERCGFTAVDAMVIDEIRYSLYEMAVTDGSSLAAFER
jgi:GNAT superfamily N-acetyltransferase